MAEVLAVAARKGHGLGKTVSLFITLVTGEGVLGDAHQGVTVQHRSRKAKDPSLPNLRQVHLLHSELLDALTEDGFSVGAGELGENILTRGLDLLGLPKGCILHFPSGAAIEITGLRNPCNQINGHTSGLMNAMLGRLPDGTLVRKGGVMALVLCGGMVQPHDVIRVELPKGAFHPLQPV